MTATATPGRPTVKKKSDMHTDSSFWVWSSWPLAAHFQGTVLADQGIEELSLAAGGWEMLKTALAFPDQLPDPVLACMRRQMEVFDYNPECPWDLPEQPWIDEQAREFVKWYLACHDEPDFEAAAPEIPNTNPVVSDAPDSAVNGDGQNVSNPVATEESKPASEPAVQHEENRPPIVPGQKLRGTSKTAR